MSEAKHFAGVSKAGFWSRVARNRNQQTVHGTTKSDKWKPPRTQVGRQLWHALRNQLQTCICEGTQQKRPDDNLLPPSRLDRSYDKKWRTMSPTVARSQECRPVSSEQSDAAFRVSELRSAEHALLSHQADYQPAPESRVHCPSLNRNGRQSPSAHDH